MLSCIKKFRKTSLSEFSSENYLPQSSVFLWAAPCLLMVALLLTSLVLFLLDARLVLLSALFEELRQSRPQLFFAFVSLA